METTLLSFEQLEQAAALLKAGKLVAFPTETVYGLGANIFCPDAIRNIFHVKGRPSDNPLIAHVSSFSQIEKIAIDLPSIFYLLAERFFPGPLTLVVKKHPCVPDIVSAGLNSIALRMPSHPIASQLIDLTGEPLVAPSANLSGKPSGTRAAHVMDDFSGKIDAVIDGGSTEYGIESTVISLLGPKPLLLRPGAISPEEIEAVLKQPLQKCASHEEARSSPGMKYKHYSPQTPVRIFYEIEKCAPTHRMILSVEPLRGLGEWRPLNAKDLYANFRDADAMSCEEVWIYCDSETQKNLSLMNRILKAAGK